MFKTPMTYKVMASKLIMLVSLLITMFLTTATAGKGNSAVKDARNSNIALKDAYIALMRPALSLCICASDVDIEMANCAIYKRDFPNNACLKCFFKCIYTEICILNPDGTIDRDTLLRTVPGVNPHIADECISASDDETDLCEKMYCFAVCLDQKIFGLP